MYRPIDIVLADDHEIFRDGFSLMIKKSPDIRLTGEASNGAELLEIAARLNPDVVVTDIKMPVMDGVEATRQLTQTHPHIGIIALSMYDEENHVLDMMQAGAKGYLLKNAHKTEIFDAIHAVYKNEYYYGEHASTRLLNMIGKSDLPFSQPKVVPDFNAKELQIIRLICREFSYKEIADQLALSKRTVEWYCEGIISKINAKSRTGIIVYAIKHNIYNYEE